MIDLSEITGLPYSETISILIGKIGKLDLLLNKVTELAGISPDDVEYAKRQLYLLDRCMAYEVFEPLFKMDPNYPNDEEAFKNGTMSFVLVPRRYYGQEIKNDVFEMRPFYWGEDEALKRLPNFKHYKSGLEIRWYKYPFRSAYTNFVVKRDALSAIVAECIKSMEDK